MFTKSKKAFTIVELVIVIAVIAILMGIMFVGGTAISNNAKASTLDSDFRTFETNLKAMVNDPSATDIQTKDGGFDPADVDTLINSYFEGDIALAAAFDGSDDVKATNTAGDSADGTGGTAGAKANRAAWETATVMNDPYGVPYRMVVLDNSTITSPTSPSSSIPAARTSRPALPITTVSSISTMSLALSVLLTLLFTPALTRLPSRIPPLIWPIWMLSRRSLRPNANTL